MCVVCYQVTRSKRGRAIYSPLHKFVNRELRAAEDAEAQNGAVGLVSDAAMKTKRPLLAKKKKRKHCLNTVLFFYIFVVVVCNFAIKHVL